MSYCDTSASAFAAVSRSACVTTFTCGLSRAIAAAALSTFGVPISGVPWITWRCRFDSATVSSSITPSVPTPAAARYSSTGAPKPPAPITSTRARPSAAWPGPPTSRSTMCRA